MKRSLITNLLQWKNNPTRKPLLLKGVRQVGKTYLLKEFGQLHFKKYHYLNFEKIPLLSKIFETDLNPHRILTELSFYLNTPINITEDLIIFDEIQECPKALTSLKYFCEDCPGIYLCAAGSLLGIHLTPASFPVGKVEFDTLYPMSFEEFLLAIEDTRALELLHTLSSRTTLSDIAHTHLWTELKNYFIVGGLPEIVACYREMKQSPLEAFTKVREKQEFLTKAYYADIAKHSGKTNAMHIHRILESIPAQLQQVQDGSITRFKFKGVVPGISHYDRLAGAIDWLQAAGLVIKVPVLHTGLIPFRGYTKENFFKLLLFDIGILGAMSGLSPATILGYDYGSYKGYFAENFVAQELITSGIPELFSWQEQLSELEFLMTVQDKTCAVEVKSGSCTKTKSLKVFVSKYSPEFQVVLSARPLKIYPEDGIFHCPLYLAGFLKRLLPS